MAQMMDIDLSAFPIEVFDEGEGHVLVFDHPSVFANFTAADQDGEEFDLNLVRVRYMDIRDRLRSALLELDELLGS